MVGGFGKTQARVDEYFALKKIETDWASERARPAGLKGSRPAYYRHKLTGLIYGPKSRWA